MFCRRCGFFAFTNFLGLRKPCLHNEQGLSKGTAYRLKRMLECRHPLGDKCGTLAKPWLLRLHDVEPPPPPAPLAILDSGSSCSRSELHPIAESELDSFAAALQEDDQVDLWADA